ncbi:MAG: ATP-binding protein [Candidatus Marinimicrobia bacterium]|jgi:MinD superfamily P-loop ATPase|nr:ATP-binding protein [Candidatus Neomarinimicrobiota bacterium]MDD4960884.1 ATP-binding protein [Candidatus Neomarinimicrobiota bacterium]MDD5709339.1 ATP-binding protein [Candidatus Neomarinimicrobiota bacterium]MDX9778359.1 ATP-binding protein [bacterium]
MKISIASGKGGTGKTTLASNLAVYLSEYRNVVLADLDVEEPNSGLFIAGNKIYEETFNTMIPEWQRNTCTLCNRCREVCNFNAITRIADEILVFPQLCHSCYACSELCPVGALPMKAKRTGLIRHFSRKSLDFIEGILDIGEEQAVPLIEGAIHYIDEHFSADILRIYDAPPGTSCPMIEAVKDADYIILVTEPTPVGLYDLELAVDTVRELRKDFGVVLNRDGIGNGDVEVYCRKEHIPLIARIPQQRRIAEYYAEGKLLYQNFPEIRNALEDIIRTLGIASATANTEKGRQ